MSAVGTGPAVSVRAADLHRGRGRRARRVLQGIDLELAPGTVTGVSGASGTGKSSLLGLLCGDLQPSAGSVTVRTADGDLPPQEARRRRPGSVGLVLQDPVASLDPLWPIGRLVAEPLRAAGRGRALARAEAADWLARVQLGHLDPRRRARDLSVGQCQRVAVARALSTGPVLLLADEPTSALDVTSAAGVARLLAGAAESGSAVLVVSHDLPLLRSLCHRLLHLEQGRLLPVPG